MGFRFTLGTVLRFRESLEQKEEQALNKTQFEMTRVRRRIAELTDELIKAKAQQESALQKSMRAFELKSREEELAQTLRTRQELQAALQALTVQRDEQMKAYLAARSNRRVLTDLRDRQHQAWELDQARVEQKRIDDIFAARAQQR